MPSSSTSVSSWSSGAIPFPGLSGWVVVRSGFASRGEVSLGAGRVLVGAMAGNAACSGVVVVEYRL